MNEPSTIYRLPCPCGRDVRIAARQAGQVVQCECGRSLTAPSMLEIRRLPPDVPPPPAARAKWRRPERCLAAGLALALLALLAEAILFSQFPSEPVVRAWLEREEAYVRTLSPWKTIVFFRQQIQNGVEMPESAGIQTGRQMIHIGMGFVAVLGGVGLLLAGAGIAGKLTSRRQKTEQAITP